jgi:hypothetical protein
MGIAAASRALPSSPRPADFGGTVPAGRHVASCMCMPHNVSPMTLFNAHAGVKGLPAATPTGRSIRYPP